MTRLIQLSRGGSLRVAIVKEPHLRLLADCRSVYELASAAAASGKKLSDTAQQRATGESLDYDAVLSRFFGMANSPAHRSSR
jgi:hypothetical protein